MKKLKIFFLVAVLLAFGAFYFSADNFGWGRSAKSGMRDSRSVAEAGFNSFDSNPYERLERTQQEDTSCRAPKKPDDVMPENWFSIDELVELHDGLNLNSLLLMTDEEFEKAYPVSKNEDGYTADHLRVLKAYRECVNSRPLVAETAFDAVDGVRYPWWSELTPQLNPELESQYDVFFLVNTQLQRAEVGTDLNNVASLLQFSFSNAGPLGIPRQHVKIIVRKYPGPIFTRDENGVIVGLVEENIHTEVSSLAGLNQLSPQLHSDYRRLRSEDSVISQSYLLPSTTGVDGNGGMKTVNGIFNLNFRRSEIRRTIPSYRVESAPMSHPLYLLTHYSNGQESGIAIHGTPLGNRQNLGIRRGSHGCARVHPDHALTLANWIFNELPKKEVPTLTWKSYEAYNSEHNRSAWIDMEKKVLLPPVLFVVFNGNQ